MPRTQLDFNDFVAAELREGDRRMDTLTAEVAALKAKMDEHGPQITAIKTDTAEMLAVFQSWRGAMRVIDMIGKLAKPLGYIVGLLASVAALWAAAKTGMGFK